MSMLKRLSTGLVLCMLIGSAQTNAAHFGTVMAAVFGGVGLLGSAMTAVLGVPPNKLLVNSYIPTDWVAEDYVAIEEECNEGCIHRSGLGSQDLPDICFYGKFTAKVKGSYLALQNNVNVSHSVERFRFCGDSEDDAKAAAQSTWPKGSKSQVWYYKFDTSYWIDGSANPFLITTSAVLGIVGIVGVISAVQCAKHARAAQVNYAPLATTARELQEP